MNSPPNPLSAEAKKGLNVLIISDIPLFTLVERGKEGVST
jgi:hypothetical protein